MAGVFVADPITAQRTELTSHGNLHGLGAMLGIPGLLIASTLLTRAVGKRAPGRRTAMRVAVAAQWLSLAAFLATMLVTSDGAFGPDVPIGIPNRALVLGYSAWLIAAARHTDSIPVTRR